MIEAPAGMVTIVGGKYTTYRPMARDAVDAAARSLGREIPPTPTEGLPLVGAPGWLAVRNQLPALSARYGVPRADPAADAAPLRRRAARRCWRRSRTSRRWAFPLDHTAGYLPVEFRYAVTHEGALTLDDVLTRRTHVAIEDPDAGVGAAEEVAALLAPVLGWDATRQKEEVAAYEAQPRLATII